ncbi:hypothetical protein B7463_g5918, partial [Scytalidium lignicola]
MSSSASRRVPPERRQRTESSCDRCKSRKQKCHRSLDKAKCSHCQHYGYDCVVTKPRKHRLYGSVESLSARLEVLESLVKGLIPEADLSSVASMRELGQSLGMVIPAAPAIPNSSDVSPAIESDSDKNEELVQDQKGQEQYIGPESSYLFQIKLRKLFGTETRGKKVEMHLFGHDPAESLSSVSSPLDLEWKKALDSFEAVSVSDDSIAQNSYIEKLTRSDSRLIEVLIKAYFEYVNVDFPVLHETSFLKQYDNWCRSSANVDPAWLATLICVLILGNRTATSGLSDIQEKHLWLQAQSILPQVLFASTITSIQAIMLMSLHLHNSNSRDICWTLTGAAVRVAIAIALHREDIETKETPWAREVRRRLWWTLYAFEQMQVLSHDRPSAIDTTKTIPIPPPHETPHGLKSNLPDFLTWSRQLIVMMASAYHTLPQAVKHMSSGPFSPTAGLMRSLSSWHRSLPPSLSLDNIDTFDPSTQRQLLLLHVQYHYVVSTVTRHALLSRFTSLSKNPTATLLESIRSSSEVCMDSGRLSCQLLLKLDAIGRFNATTWWDVYYMYSSTLILVLSIICDVTQKGHDSVTEPRWLLGQCANLMGKHSRNPKIPGSIYRWATVVGELNSMVRDFVQKSQHKQYSAATESGVPPFVENITRTAPPLADGGVSNARNGDATGETYRANNDESTSETGSSDILLDVDQNPPNLNIFENPECHPPGEPDMYTDDKIYHSYPYSFLPDAAHNERLWQEGNWDRIGEMLLEGGNNLQDI